MYQCAVSVNLLLKNLYDCVSFHAVDEITVRYQTFSKHLWHLSEQKSMFCQTV